MRTAPCVFSDWWRPRRESPQRREVASFGAVWLEWVRGLAMISRLGGGRLDGCNRMVRFGHAPPLPEWSGVARVRTPRSTPSRQLRSAHAMARSPVDAPTSKTVGYVRVVGLGAAEIWLGEHRITPTTDVLFGLLLFLTEQHPRPIAQSAVLRLMWPDIEESNRRHALRQLVYRIRRLGCPVSTANGSVLLEVKDVTSDVARIGSPTWITQAPDDEIRGALSIFSEYTPNFSSAYIEWLERVRAEAATHARDGCLERVRIAKSQGRWSDVDQWARDCLAIDPFNEEATLARAEAMAMRGSKVEAQSLLTEYITELGADAAHLSLPAKILRRRISDLADSAVPNAAESSLGREREFTLLVESAAATKRGRSIATLVHGASGTGKTVLLTQFSTFCETQGYSCIFIKVVEELHGADGSLLSTVLQSALQLPGALACSPEELTLLRDFASKSSVATNVVPGPLPSEDFERIGKATCALFRELETEKPLLVILDDYSSADRVSLSVLTRVTASMTGRRFMVAISTRTYPRHPPVVPAAQSAMDLHLGNLSREATSRLVMSTFEARGAHPDECEVERIYDISGGHPLYVRELLASGTKTEQPQYIPPTLEGMIWANVRELSPSALRFLSLLAVIQSGDGIDDLFSMTDFDDPQLDSILQELSSAGFLPSSGAAHLRPYPAVSQAIRGRLAPPVIASLHFRVGCLLERKAIQSESAAYAWEGARHLGLAREGDRAAALLRAASGRQLAVGNSSDAAEMLKGASRCALNERTQLHCKAEELRARRLIGDWERAGVLCEEISGDFRKRLLPSKDLLDVYLTSLEAELHLSTNPHLTMLRTAAVMAETQYPSDQRERAANLTAILASNLADQENLSAAVAAIPSESLHKRGASFDVQMVRIIAEHDLGNLEAARALTARLVSRSRVTGSAEELVRALLAASVPERSSGAYDTTISLLREAHAESESHQLWSLATRCADTLSGVLFDAGDLIQAQQWQDVADATCKSLFSHWTNRTVIHQRLRLSAHANTMEVLNKDFLDEYSRVVLQDGLTMRRNHDLAALAMVALRHNEVSILRPIVEQLLAGLHLCRGQRRLDYILAAAVAGARAIGHGLLTRREAVSFCDKHRNVKIPYLWFLEAAIAADYGRLFPRPS